MPDIFGIQCGPEIEVLIEKVREAWAPAVFIIDDIENAPPDVPRKMRGAFVSDVPGVFINPRRSDTDAYTIAHELGHALVNAAGWPTLSSRKEIDQETAMGWIDWFDNRIQHIAIEPFLREAGIQTSTPHKIRIDRDINFAQRDLKENWLPNDPGFYVPRAIKYAEAKYCANRKDFNRFRDAMQRLSPHVIQLGRKLVAVINQTFPSDQRKARKAVVGWIKVVADHCKGHKTRKYLSPLEWVAVSPVFLNSKDLDEEARGNIRINPTSIQKVPGKTVFRVEWGRDGSAWAFIMTNKIDDNIRITEQMNLLLSKPLSEVINVLKLPYVVKAD